MRKLRSSLRRAAAGWRAVLFARSARRAGRSTSTSSTAPHPRCRSRWCRSASRAAAVPPETDVGEVDPQRSGPLAASSARWPRATSSNLPTREARRQVRDLAPAQAGLPRRRPHDRWRRRRACASSSSCSTSPSSSACAGLAISGQRSGLRDVAHQIADLIYEKILGVRGAFWTRIAYVTAIGTGAEHPVRADGRRFGRLQSAGRRALARAAAVAGVVAGRHASSPTSRSRAATRRSTSRTSPPARASWCRPRKGINGAPAFSPDGSKLALTLSNGGNPDIYIMDLGSRATDADHQAFRDRYRGGLGAGRAEHLSSRPTAPASRRSTRCPPAAASRRASHSRASTTPRPSVSTTARHKIAMVQGNGNVYRIAVLDRADATQMTLVSPGNQDESPSFAPNGSMLLYAASEGSRGVLYAVSADGRVRQRLVLAEATCASPPGVRSASVNQICNNSASERLNACVHPIFQPCTVERGNP